MSIELFKRFVSSIVLLPLTFFFVIKGSFIFNFFLGTIFLLSCKEWNYLSHNKKYKLIGYFFIFFSCITVFLIRNNGEENSLEIFILILLICIFTDLGGYIIGKLIKGPIVSKISPNKTYSGVFGSFLFSIAVTFLALNFTVFFNNLSTNQFTLYLLTIFLSLVSQIGDFTVSYFKRLAKIKDTGTLIPGHGGILDRIDGMLFAFPAYYFISIIYQIS